MEETLSRLLLSLLLAFRPAKLRARSGAFLIADEPVRTQAETQALAACAEADSLPPSQAVRLLACAGGCLCCREVSGMAIRARQRANDWV